MEGCAFEITVNRVITNGFAMTTYLQTELWYKWAASLQCQPGSAFVRLVFPPSRTSVCLSMTAETGARNPESHLLCV